MASRKRPRVRSQMRLQCVEQLYSDQRWQELRAQVEGTRCQPTQLKLHGHFTMSGIKPKELQEQTHAHGLVNFGVRCDVHELRGRIKPVVVRSRVRARNEDHSIAAISTLMVATPSPLRPRQLHVPRSTAMMSTIACSL